MFGRQKINLETKSGIESLKNVTSNSKKRNLVKKNPEVVLYAGKYWSKDEENFKKLVHFALTLKPEIIINFKGKDGLVASKEFVETALLSDPMIVTKMNDELREFIDDKMFIRAFVKNPLILSVKDLKILKHRYSRKVSVIEDDKQVEKKVTTTLRTECLKAIRLSEGTSKYHEGYDDIAFAMAKMLKASREFQGKKYSTELLQNFATLMNAMIKKQNQKLRVVSAEAWLVNNGKPMYKAIRSSAKQDSSLEGLITDMPTELLPAKVIKKLIVAAVLTNPEYYLKLDEYGFGKYKDDNTVKYNVYKSLKKHGKLKQIDNYLDEQSAQKAKNRYNGIQKRPPVRPRKPKLPAVIESQEEKQY